VAARRADARFLAAFDALPRGTFAVRYGGRRWIATRQALAGGRAEKLVAEAPGGAGHVSVNLYRLASGARMAPCEMPLADVRAFVLGAVVEG
jgi:hypothetical protein